MILTVEALKNEGDPGKQMIAEIAICFDQEGFAVLSRELAKLQHAKSHTHLMTPSWSGSELTEELQGGEDYVLVNHLRLVRI